MTSLLLAFFLAVHANDDEPIEKIQLIQQETEEQRIQKEIIFPHEVKIDPLRPYWGDLKAPLVLLVYSDFECGYCKQAIPMLQALDTRYGKKLVVQFRHIPLLIHTQGRMAARWFEVVGRQDLKAGMNFHKKLFQGQEKLKSLGENFLVDIVKSLELDLKKVRAELQGSWVEQIIQRDEKEAKELKISVTPGFNAAGVVVKGLGPIETFTDVLDKRLNQIEGK